MAYFFLRLKNIYGALYTAQYPTEEDLRMVKREYARYIGKHSRQVLAEAFDLVHKERIRGSKVFEFINIDKILGLCGSNWEAQCHKPFKPESLLEDHGAKERAKAAGAAALREMMATVGIKRGDE